MLDRIFLLYQLWTESLVKKKTMDRVLEIVASSDYISFQ
jgi:hypothetical protein